MPPQTEATARAEDALQDALVALRDGPQSDGQNCAVLTLAHTHELAALTGSAVGEVERRALVTGIVPLRYQRNIGTVGLGGQARLLYATVAVVGCGGLGGWVTEGLARMGVGHLILIDADCFDETNLNRQLGCVESTLGMPKALVLAERVRLLNGAVQPRAHVERLTEANAASLLAGAEVVVDALDTIPDRLALGNAAAAAGLVLVHGAIAGYTGQVMTVLPGDPGLEALYGGLGVPDRGIETTLGNPAATPMMIAAWQVHEVVKFLIGQGELIRGRVLVLDAETGQVAEIRLS